jgi:hypothetical protein
MPLSSLQKAQIKFDQDTARLIDYAAKRGIACFTHEKGIIQERKIILSNGKIAKGRDAVHMLSGNHYRFLAFDLIVFDKNGERIESGSDPVWTVLGSFWESLDKDNDNGREWGDANHFSRIWEGKH